MALSASDPDGDPVSFAAAAAQSLAYVLDRQLGLVAYHPGEDNWGGRQEKWMTDAGGAWYFLLPDGALYRWSGAGGTGTPVGTPGASYHADPDLLVKARPDHPHATLSLSGSTLTIDRGDGFVGAMVVTATASDGKGGTDTKSFTVTVTSAAASTPSGGPGSESPQPLGMVADVALESLVPSESEDPFDLLNMRRRRRRVFS